MASRRWPTKLVMSWEAVGDVQLCTCRNQFELLNKPSYCCTVVAIWKSILSFTISSVASEPSSVFSPKPCRRHYFDFLDYFAETCRRCIWITLSKPRRRSIFFDDNLGHGNHSGELLLFVGCIVIFVVSFLICMFQDSVPAGSDNDPFLSSVCTCRACAPYM